MNYVGPVEEWKPIGGQESRKPIRYPIGDGLEIAEMLAVLVRHNLNKSKYHMMARGLVMRVHQSCDVSCVGILYFEGSKKQNGRVQCMQG